MVALQIKNSLLQRYGFTFICSQCLAFHAQLWTSYSYYSLLNWPFGLWICNPVWFFYETLGEPRGILGKEGSKPVPVKKTLHRSVSFTEPENKPRIDKQIGRCKSAATLETMAGAGQEPVENLSGKVKWRLLPRSNTDSKRGDEINEIYVCY